MTYEELCSLVAAYLTAQAEMKGLLPALWNEIKGGEPDGPQVALRELARMANKVIERLAECEGTTAENVRQELLTTETIDIDTYRAVLEELRRKRDEGSQE